MEPTRYTQQMISEYMGKGYWEPTTYADLWDRNASEHPEKEAIVDSQTRLTWIQAKQRIDRIALGLVKLGIKRDQVIVTELPDCVDFPLFGVACEKAGIIRLSVMRTFRHREMEYILRYTEAVGVAIPWKFRDFDYFQMIEEIKPNLPHLKYVFISEEEVPQGTISIDEMAGQPLEKKYPLEKLRGRGIQATEVAWIDVSTGTTGFPKIVEAPLCYRMCANKEHVRKLKISGDDIIAAIAPVAGVGRLVYFACPIAGAKGVLLGHFTAEEALRLIETERVTVMAVVPAQLVMMLQAPTFDRYDLSSLRAIQCGGAYLPYEVAEEAERKFGCPVVIHYGAQDAGSLTGVFIDDPVDVRRFTVGKPHAGNEIRVVDDARNDVPPGEVGEIIFRGPCTVGGFYKDPQATWEVWTEDGWFKTGDLGKFDEQGNLIIVGRKKDIIIRGGWNIYPGEIERLLMQHPKVANAAVVRMPDLVMGEKACAYVVPRSGQQLDFEEMASFLKEKKIATYKLPERLELIDKLPLVADQKVDKRVLEQDIVEKLKAEGKT